MQLVLSPSRGWLKVPLAARLASIPLSHAKVLIIAGKVPVAIDRAGYMWVSSESFQTATRPTVSLA